MDNAKKVFFVKIFFLPANGNLDQAKNTQVLSSYLGGYDGNEMMSLEDEISHLQVCKQVPRLEEDSRCMHVFRKKTIMWTPNCIGSSQM